MKTLILMHVEREGPGTLGSFLRDHGAATSPVRLHAGEALPEDPCAFDAIVSLGGPMNVYEDEKFPFLQEETALLARAVGSGVAVLGICLGAQLIARACGAAVYPAPSEEVGWSTVSLTPEGIRDRVLGDTPGELPVLQWHGDTFDVPRGGALLATGRECRNQAFRHRRAYGLQFHLEVDRRMLEEWFKGDPRGDEIVAGYDDRREGFTRTARTFYRRFFRMATERTALPN